MKSWMIKLAQRTVILLTDQKIGKGLEQLGVLENSQNVWRSSLGVFIGNLFSEYFTVGDWDSRFLNTVYAGGCFFVTGKGKSLEVIRPGFKKVLIGENPILIKGGSEFCIFCFNDRFIIVDKTGKKIELDNKYQNLKCYGNSGDKAKKEWRIICDFGFCNSLKSVFISRSNFYINICTNEGFWFSVVFEKTLDGFESRWIFRTKIGKNLKFTFEDTFIVDDIFCLKPDYHLKDFDDFDLRNEILVFKKDKVIFCYCLTDRILISYKLNSVEIVQPEINEDSIISNTISNTTPDSIPNTVSRIDVSIDLDDIDDSRLLCGESKMIDDFLERGNF